MLCIGHPNTSQRSGVGEGGINKVESHTLKEPGLRGGARLPTKAQEGVLRPGRACLYSTYSSPMAPLGYRIEDDRGPNPKIEMPSKENP